MTRERKPNRTAAQRARQEVETLETRLSKLTVQRDTHQLKVDAINREVNAVQHRLDYAMSSPDLLDTPLS